MLLAVFVGGGLGACLRYGLTLHLSSATFPWGLTWANLGGCFLAGLLGSLLHSGGMLSKELIAAGFLGGLTSFSSFSYELIHMMVEERWLMATSLWLVGSVGNTLACALGFFLWNCVRGL